MFCPLSKEENLTGQEAYERNAVKGNLAKRSTNKDPVAVWRERHIRKLLHVIGIMLNENL